MSPAFSPKSTTYIAQGEHAIGCEPDQVISTILGSCVAVCLWDPDQTVGGMNHILLPDSREASAGMDRFGGAAMEFLVNDLVKQGASRSRLRAKVFGGAAMLSAKSGIGARNAAFAEAYLRAEGIPCDAQDTGGEVARQVRFWPYSGQAKMRLVRAEPEQEAVRPAPPANDVELF